jgi:hypothetical protein
VHQAICGRWAYRRNPQYLRFVQHARATQRVTLRKFRDRGFQVWLQRELRSRAVKRSAETAGANRVGRQGRSQCELPLGSESTRRTSHTA